MADTIYNIRASADGNQHSRHPAGDFVQGGGGGGGGAGTQPPLVVLPQNRFWYGDSQIRGRANGLTTSNRSAFIALWDATTTAPQTNSYDGSGGRGLQDTFLALQGAWGTSSTPRPGPEWVHFVETGGQDEPGQATPAEWGDTLEWGVRWIRAKSPNCIISTETQFSFGREGEAGRDWTNYKTELYARAQKLRNDGITVHVVDNDGRIKALQSKLGAPAVWYQPGDPLNRQYHFTDVGNLMTAMAIFWQFGYSVNDLDLSPILAEGYVTLAQANACFDVLNGV